jgi:hypothetical protein
MYEIPYSHYIGSVLMYIFKYAYVYMSTSKLAYTDQNTLEFLYK